MKNRMAKLRVAADCIIDTSNKTPGQLRGNRQPFH